MCDISLAFKPCNSNALCGISVCFRTLSPSHRQIAHALLTRPPLIRSRSSLTVRLECVKHAASVHPEPGSNSLKNGILNSNFHPNLKSFSELFFLSFFYFSTLCFKVIDKNLFVLFRLLFNFQGPFCAPRFERSCSISQTNPFVNTFFHIFSYFFTFFAKCQKRPLKRSLCWTF